MSDAPSGTPLFQMLDRLGVVLGRSDIHVSDESGALTIRRDDAA